jgi:hypothetical protein
VQVIDCIEFNDDLRVIDPVADMAFLAMDLEHLGRRDLSQAFSLKYVALSGDRSAERKADFYMAYRAMVRCMAHGMMAAQGRAGSAEAAAEYADLAHRIAARQRGKVLVVMAGTTGSGKSTVASYIARAWGAVHIQTDVVRKRLAGMEPTTRTPPEALERLYSPEMSARTYKELERLGLEALTGGNAVVLDGTFPKRDHRAAARHVGLLADAAVVIVECKLPEAEQIRRLRQRSSANDSVSDGTVGVYVNQRQEWQDVLDREAHAVIRVDTSAGPDNWGVDLLRALWAASWRDPHFPEWSSDRDDAVDRFSQPLE